MHKTYVNRVSTLTVGVYMHSDLFDGSESFQLIPEFEPKAGQVTCY